jgi:hypothetical protein
VPTGGVDTITAQDDPTTPTLTRSVRYYWGATTQLVFDAAHVPIAQPGAASDNAAAPETITVTAEDGNGAPVANTHLWLALTPQGSAPSGTAVAQTGPPNGATCTSSTAALGTPNDPVQVNADANGIVTVCYTGPVPTASTGAIDVLSVEDDKDNPSVQNQDFYNTKQQSLDHYGFSPSPLASAGSLPAGGNVPVVVTPSDTSGPIPYMTVFLSFSNAPSHGGSANAQDYTDSGPNALTTSPTAYVSDGNGAIAVAYTAGSATAGTDALEAQNAASSPSKTGFDYYTYHGATHYVFSPDPIAARGTLTGSSPAIPVTVTAEDSAASPNPVPNSVVFLSFAAAGPATTAATAKVGTTSLTSAPQRFVTDNNGQVSITYTTATGTTRPTGGKDEITAANATSAPTISAADDYLYGTAVDYSVSPSSAIAPAGSLGASQSTPVAYTVTNHGSGTPAGSAKVYLSFTQATGGGSAASAQCAGTALTSTPAACTADVNGLVTVTYTAPSTLPAGGRDTITAADASSSPSQTLSDSYTFAGAYSFSAVPLAASGTLTPGQVKGSTLTVTDGASALPGAHVWLSFTPAAGSDAIMSANGNALSASPSEVIADGSGHVALSYRSSNATPSGTTDTVTAQNASSSPTLSGTDTYTYHAPTPPPPAHGYYLVASDGGLFPFGSALQHSYGSTGGMQLNAPIVGMAVTPDHNGYYLVASDGGIFPFGPSATAHSYGSTGGTHLNAPIVGMAVTPDGNGYYLVASDGGIFPFGPTATSHSYGSTGGMHLNKPIVGMALTPDGNGYYLVASDGGIFPFGPSASGHSYGSTGNMQLNAPIVGMAVSADGNGYYLVASDGGIFPFGPTATSHSYGSTGGMHLNQPIVGMALATDGNGYYLVASDGGLFPFGSAQNASYGSEGGQHLNKPIVGMTAI